MRGIVGHRDRFVDKQNGDAVLDPVRATKPRVIEELLMAGVNQQQRPAVLRTDQDAQKFLVEHNGRLADADEDARVLAGISRHSRRQRRTHARRRLADAEVVPGLLVRVDLVLRERPHLALVGDRLLQRFDERLWLGR